MKNSTVINNAPWVTAFGTTCTAASFFVGLPLSVALNLLGLDGDQRLVGRFADPSPGLIW